MEKIFEFLINTNPLLSHASTKSILFTFVNDLLVYLRMLVTS